jgi:hypothetical protein
VGRDWYEGGAKQPIRFRARERSERASEAEREERQTERSETERQRDRETERERERERERKSCPKPMSRFTYLGLVAPFLLFQGEDRVMEMGAHRLLLLCGGVLLPLSAKEWAGLAGDSHAGRNDDRKDCIARNRLTINKSSLLSVACGLSHRISCTSFMSCLHDPFLTVSFMGHSQYTSPHFSVPAAGKIC